MGYKKFKRPILAPAGLQMDGGSTFTGAVNISGALTISGAQTISGVQTYTAAPTYSGVGPISAVQTLDSGDTGTVITGYGVTTIWQTTAGTTNQTWKLAGAAAGASKTILFNAGDRTITITCTANGTDPFYKSTDTVSLVGTSDVDNFGVIQLSGVTSIHTGATGLKWNVDYKSTAISISA